MYDAGNTGTAESTDTFWPLDANTTASTSCTVDEFRREVDELEEELEDSKPQDPLDEDYWRSVARRCRDNPKPRRQFRRCELRCRSPTRSID